MIWPLKCWGTGRTAGQHRAVKLLCLDVRPKLLQEQDGNVPPMPPQVLFPQAHAMIQLLLNICLQYLTWRETKTKTLEVGNNCFVLPYLIKLGDKSMMLVLLIYLFIFKLHSGDMGMQIHLKLCIYCSYALLCFSEKISKAWTSCKKKNIWLYCIFWK